ncbi:hypothetical protein EIP91_011935 [Steccherinum ochraceum]|uniref:Uncharacterized protein n=1 Tax=Steccherinum ochraceum TaxID=92696 RepID=A0A4V2MWW1_9APHY|nr:hypothetical protein EIP91_011935 [Steccherinum ochraceum]
MRFTTVFAALVAVACTSTTLAAPARLAARGSDLQTVHAREDLLAIRDVVESLITRRELDRLAKREELESDPVPPRPPTPPGPRPGPLPAPVPRPPSPPPSPDHDEVEGTRAHGRG